MEQEKLQLHLLYSLRWLDCKEFVNVDEVAKGLSPFQSESVSFHAGRIMLERINEFAGFKN